MTSMSVLIATAEQEVFRGMTSMLIAPSLEGELAIAKLRVVRKNLGLS